MIFLVSSISHTRPKLYIRHKKILLINYSMAWIVCRCAPVLFKYSNHAACIDLNTEPRCDNLQRTATYSFSFYRWWIAGFEQWHWLNGTTRLDTVLNDWLERRQICRRSFILPPEKKCHLIDGFYSGESIFPYIHTVFHPIFFKVYSMEKLLLKNVWLNNILHWIFNDFRAIFWILCE